MLLVSIWLIINSILFEWYKSLPFYDRYDFLTMLLGVFVSFAWVYVMTSANNFPSLITTNATLAIVIDREYVADEYENIKSSIEDYLVYAKREILKHGGVNVQFFSWTSINVKRDLTAILSIASCADTWRLFHAAEDEHILHMAISEADCPRLPPNVAVTVPLLIRGEELPQLLLDLRTSSTVRWSSIVILYDATLTRDMIIRLITSLTRESKNFDTRGSSVSLLKIEGNSTSEMKESIFTLLSDLQLKRVGSNFMVISSYDVVETVMEIAKGMKLVNTKTQWLYLISDTDAKTNNMTRFKKLMKEGDNLAFICNNTITKTLCVGGLKCHSEEILASFTAALDDAIQDEFELAGQVSDEEWEAIRPTKLERRTSLLENVKSHLVKYGKCDNCTSWLIYAGETWAREYQQNSSSDSTAELLQVGNWRPSDGAAMIDELFPHIAHGFRGRTLPLVSYHNPPWQIIRTNSSGSVIEYRGLVFDIIKELSANLNFTYTVQIPKISTHKSYTQTNESSLYQIADLVTNRIPDVIIDMIRNKTVAIGACAVTITEDSKRLVNFTRPVSVQSYTFLAARPKELSRALLFMSPFTGDTWLCLCASIVSMGPLLYFINRFSPMYEYRGIRKVGGLSSIENCMWYMYGALLQQGGMHLPSADSARILVGAWWLVVLVVATTYCGNLVAFLTFPKIDIPITTIDELLEHRETVTWSFAKGSYLESQLKVAPESKYRELFEGKSDLRKDKEMIERVENGKHVFIDWKIRLQYIMKKQFLESDRCDLALGLDEFLNEKLALIVAQDTPYLTTINDEIKKLHQVGLIQKWLTDYLPKRDRCWKNRRVVEVNNHTVNMDDMQGSFFVLFIGFLLSFLIIISEYLWYKYSSKRKVKVIQPFTT